MYIKAGILLQSAPGLADPHFQQACIFITEYNNRGAMGFVINKLFSRRLNELEEFSSSLPFPIYKGGPVDKTHLYFIHQRPDLIEEGVIIANGVYLGGNFKQAVASINNRQLTESDIKIFIGYCGWDDGELEAEIAEGSWVAAGAGIYKVLFNDREDQ